MIRQEFAEAFNDYLQKNKLSIYKLSKILNVTAPDLSMYRRGRAYPTKKKVLHINEILGTDFPYEKRFCFNCNTDISDLHRRYEYCLPCTKKLAKARRNTGMKKYDEKKKKEENKKPIRPFKDINGYHYGEVVAKDYLREQPTIQEKIKRLKKEGKLK